MSEWVKTFHSLLQIDQSLAEKYIKKSIYDMHQESAKVFLDRNLYKKSLLLQIPLLSYWKIYKLSRDSYNLWKYSNQCERDMVQYEYEILHKIVLPLSTKEECICRFEDNYLEVHKRMFLRIELYLHGWTIEQIEHYIQDKWPDCNMIDFDSSYQDIMMNNLLFILGLQNNVIKRNWKGRPTLPESIKKSYKDEHRQLMKQRMNQLYQSKSNLLTKEEFQALLKYLPTDCPSRETILSKCKYFTS